MKYRTLSQHPAIFLKMTGLHLAEFEQLVVDVLPPFGEAERARLSRPNRQRAIGGGRTSELDEQDQILLTIVWLRLYPTHAVLGYLFGIHQPTVGRYIRRVLPILAQAGRDTMRMPDPGRKRRRSLDGLLADTPQLALIIDTFEQKVQRPKDRAVRERYYSGKKKTHTLKSQVAINADTGSMVDIAASVPGPLPDIKVLEQARLLERLPDGVGGLGDSGYQGIAKLHPLGCCPRKKPWGKPRPPQDIAYNRAFSSRRIWVENSINRLRRYQCLTQTDRQHRQSHTARVCAVAGLVNRQLAYRMAA